MKILSILILATLGACASGNYRIIAPEGRPQAQIDNENYACARGSRRATMPIQAYNECMAKFGYAFEDADN